MSACWRISNRQPAWFRKARLAPFFKSSLRDKPIAEGASSNTQEAARKAALLFLHRVTGRFDVRQAFLFGTQARHHAQSDSDVDVAVVLNGQRERLTETVLLFSNIAYDVFMETGVLIDAHPIWNGEWDRPGTGPNPYLVENIKRDGIRL